MYRRFISFAVMLLMVVALFGCSQKDVPLSSVSQNDTLTAFTLAADSSSLDARTQAPSATSGNVTYSSGLVQIYDANHGDYDWLVIFYLPYNPGSATFQGRDRWGWSTYSGLWAQVHETLWTSRGFRIKILVGSKVTSFCGTSPGNYRLLY